MPRGRPHASWLRKVESSEGYGHGGPGVCLGDGQTEAEEVPSQGGRGDALFRRMPPIPDLTFEILHPSIKSDEIDLFSDKLDRKITIIWVIWLQTVNPSYRLYSLSRIMKSLAGLRFGTPPCGVITLPLHSRVPGLRQKPVFHFTAQLV